MKKLNVIFALLWSITVLGFAGCDDDNNGSQTFINNSAVLRCTPQGIALNTPSSPNDLFFEAEASATGGGLLLLPEAGVTVDVSFGSGITSATNLADSSAMNLSGDQAVTDSTGDVQIEADCADLSDTTANPCTVSFNAVVDGFNVNCFGGYSD